jgi:hypothetical protein
MRESNRTFLRKLPLLLLAGACNTAVSYPTAISRPAQDAPEHFVLGDGSALNGTPGAATCSSPLRDPRGGDPITLERSYQGSGDYRVSGGRYGVGAGELLRVNCANGTALGIVRG